MRSPLLTSMLALVATACTGKSNDTGEDSRDIVGSIHFLDVVSGEVLAGVTVSGGDADSVANANGDDERVLDPNSPVQLVGRKDAYLDDHFFLYTGDSDFEASVLMISEAQANVLLGLLDLERDPTKGLVVVTVNDDPEGGDMDLDGASVYIDQESDPSIVADPSSGFGVALGSTIQAGTGGWIAFPNVPEGAVHIEVITPEGEECVIYPGSSDDMDFESFAGAMSVIAYKCT